MSVQYGAKRLRPGWDTLVGFVVFVIVDVEMARVSPHHFWTPAWWMAAVALLAVFDVTRAAYSIMRHRIGVLDVDPSQALEDLRRVPNMIRSSLALIAASFVAQMWR